MVKMKRVIKKIMQIRKKMGKTMKKVVKMFSTPLSYLPSRN